MRRSAILTAFVVGVITCGCAATDEHGAARKPAAQPQRQAASKTTPADQPVRGGATRDDHGHTHDVTGEVPAFVTSASELKLLPATLAPEKFTGKQRLGYEAVRQIPRTIAQLPCYCHCDKGFGHKSLHSCFVDDHAAHCAVCIDEALMAYKMEKEDKLTPEQIRERIVAHYSSKQ
ncbi:MAG TPA: CYCXC family (seleno)protein [Pyrinomonadaceae bacterium]|nr:CYCXC family (seleno)protein [Pyrinomonadaceae bacterium]